MKNFLLFLFIGFMASNRLSAQCQPTVINCPVQDTLTVCDTTQNNPLLWHKSYWWEYVLNTSNLPDAPTDLSIAVKDLCEPYRIQCLVYVDFDHDSIFETVIHSDSFPLRNVVYVGNSLNANFWGGTPQAFDQRELPPNEQYQWVLETTTANDTTIARLRWNTADQPNTYVLPELPYGRYKIVWMAVSPTEEVPLCSKITDIEDCHPPIIECYDVNMNIWPQWGMSPIIWANDLVFWASDNATTHYVSYAVRRVGAGTGIPVDEEGNLIINIQFSCLDIGIIPLEIWAIDLAGNAAYCEASVTLAGDTTNCNTANTKVCIVDCLGQPTVEYADVQITVNNANIYLEVTDAIGCMSLPLSIPLESSVEICPTKDFAPLTGVNMDDLELIAKHITGEQPFLSPYHWIAADANKDNVIDSADIVDLYNLITGVYSQLPNNTAWRFMSKGYKFPVPSNPLAYYIPECVQEDSLLPNFAHSFIAIKIGDVTNLCGSNVSTDLGADQPRFKVQPPQPNPTNDGVSITVEKSGDRPIYVRMYDLTGRLVYDQSMEASSGTHTLEISGSAFPSSGIYIWQISDAGYLVSGKILRI